MSAPAATPAERTGSILTPRIVLGGGVVLLVLLASLLTLPWTLSGSSTLGLRHADASRRPPRPGGRTGRVVRGTTASAARSWPAACWAARSR